MHPQCRKPVLLCLLSIAISFSGLPSVTANPGPVQQSRSGKLRRPQTLTRLGDRIYVGNRDSGSISILDVKSLALLNEYRISNQVDDLIGHSDPGLLLAVDSTSHELLQIAVTKDALQVTSRMTVADYPASVVIMPSGDQASVASRWSRRVTLVMLAADHRNPLRATRIIDLPFAPQKQLVLDNRHILVSDAFAGQLAVVDAETGTIRTLRAVNGHNIRGLALTDGGRQILMTHQIMLSLQADFVNSRQ